MTFFECIWMGVTSGRELHLFLVKLRAIELPSKTLVALIMNSSFTKPRIISCHSALAENLQMMSEDAIQQRSISIWWGNAEGQMRCSQPPEFAIVGTGILHP